MIAENTPRKVDAIIQARMGSGRLPEKILVPIGGKPLLLRVVDRLRQCSLVNRVIVATTTETSDDRVHDLCRHYGIYCFRGSVQNVLDRFLGACVAFGCDRILRVCADNPFLDPELMTVQLSAFGADIDYCTYVTRSGEPIILKPVGFFAEAVTRSALERVARESEHVSYAEHVTMFIYRHPERFRILSIQVPSFVDPEWRFTVDYQEDVDFCNRLLAILPEPRAIRVRQALDRSPDLANEIAAFSKTHAKSFLVQQEMNR